MCAFREREREGREGGRKGERTAGMKGRRETDWEEEREVGKRKAEQERSQREIHVYKGVLAGGGEPLRGNNSIPFLSSPLSRE